ncbi:MAG: TIR domain-containing protein [Oscillospiraceae bacterium]|nr:TIR domain-containing protein [Oscillospiraceae bacterium]
MRIISGACIYAEALEPCVDGFHRAAEGARDLGFLHAFSDKLAECCISLESKLGVEYEPYIFAALNSARVMIVVGTDYDNFNAVWVKNEWSRYLALIASGQKKTLIPCFKNIDAYDMPREFNKLAAQDMGKVGAMQDLLRGVEKLLDKNEGSAAAHADSKSATEPLLTRAFMFLEDGNWKEADMNTGKAELLLYPTITESNRRH